MRDDKRRQRQVGSTEILVAIALVSVVGCGAERFSGVADAENPDPAGSGGPGPDTDGSGTVLIGTGGTSGTDDANPMPIPMPMPTGGSGGAGTDSDTDGGAMGTGSGGNGGGTGGAAGSVTIGTGTGGHGTGGGGGSAVDSGADKAQPLDAADAGDAPRDAGTCPGGTNDLSDIGTGDFKISFRVVTTKSGWMALLNQRPICSFSTFWDVRQSGANRVRIELDDSSSVGYESQESTVAINDGKSHGVSIARVAGTLTIRIDGAAAGEGPSTTSLGSLAALRVGDDICASTVNDPVTATFSGTLTDVCITRGN